MKYPRQPSQKLSSQLRPRFSGKFVLCNGFPEKLLRGNVLRKLQFHIPAGVAVPAGQPDDGANRSHFHLGVLGAKSANRNGKSKAASSNLPVVPGFKWDF